MNTRDSCGFSTESHEIYLEIVRSDGFVLLEFPTRDLREWVIGIGGRDGAVQQYAGARFRVQFPINQPGEPAFAFARLDDAMRAVEFAKMVHTACGISGGVQQ
jgi:hypothetical protein